jgi:hypothetical protein
MMAFWQEISCDEWAKAGLPFEGWLRYVQLPVERRRRVDELFTEKYRKVVDDETTSEPKVEERWGVSDYRVS